MGGVIDRTIPQSENLSNAKQHLLQATAVEIDDPNLEVQLLVNLGNCLDTLGRSIEAILLGGFLKLFPGLVASKKLYICEAPLFLQDEKYYWTSDEIDVNKKFQRFKGLGEMNSNEIFDSMINPENRKLLQVVITDEQDRNYALELVSNPLTRKTMLTEGGYLE
jgi:DNA gyrase/topoisomerase IV subunit B